MNYLAFIVFVYLIAAIPFGWCISGFFGIDIHRAGSGNIGATNVTRMMGLGLGSIVFILDFLKAAIPVFVAVKYSGYAFASIVGFVAVFAHVFSVYVGFEGGKGVAPMFGVYFILNPLIFLGISFIWGIVFFLFKHPFLSSLSACFLGAMCSYFIFKSAVFLPLLGGTVIIFMRHIGNIKRCLKAR